MSPDATPLPGYNREGYGHGSTEHAAQRGPIVNQPYYTNPARTTSGSAAERDTLPETQEEGDSPGGAQERFETSQWNSTSTVLPQLTITQSRGR